MGCMGAMGIVRNLCRSLYIILYVTIFAFNYVCDFYEHSCKYFCHKYSCNRHAIIIISTMASQVDGGL